MYDNILHKPLKLRTNITSSAREILEGVRVTTNDCYVNILLMRMPSLFLLLVKYFIKY